MIWIHSVLDMVRVSVFTKHTIHISFFAQENGRREVGEMAQWLRALYALAEGPGSVPSTRL